MEARNFITAREILEGGNWLSPTLNGEYRLAKPPFPTWVTAIMAKFSGDVRRLVALRFPAGLMALLMTISMYGLARFFSKVRIIPLLAACVLGTSFYVLFMARRGTWDIYCHSFMLAAIWVFTYALKLKGPADRWFLRSGFLMGVSFMSKGPVSFYVLLVPYLTAYMAAFGLSEFRLKYREIASCVLICIVISCWWPIYTFWQLPEATANIISAETEAWQNRHVRPFWHYWNFPVQSGVWTLFIIASLIPGYARRRVEKIEGNYKFLLLWVVLTILLLSIIPEKKERYLMPGLISQSLLVAHLLGYLITQSYQGLTKSDKVLLKINFYLVILVCLLGPGILYRLAITERWISMSSFAGFSLTLLLLGMLVLLFFLKHKFWPGFVMIFIVAAALCVWLPVVYQGMAQNNFTEQKLTNEALIDSVQGLNYYSLGTLRPEEIWDIGKVVKPIRTDGLKKLPAQSVVFVNENHISQNDLNLFKQIPSDSIGVFAHYSNPGTAWSVWRLH